MTAENETVRYEVVDGIAVVTLNRPHAANSIDPSLARGFGESMKRADDDPTVRVIVLTAAGEKIFCAGMDLRAFAETKEGEDLDIDQRFIDFARVGTHKPLIAAVNGAAVGGGFELMLGCDMAIAADHARFGVPEVKVGLVPGGGGTLLTRVIPPAIGYELALTGELMPASRALELGLLNAVVPGPDVLPTAMTLARKIAANAPLAVQAVKKAMRIAAESDAAAAWASVDAVAPPVAASEDALEGARAFTEHRAANWKGR
ncbi:MAG TPA: enoyl-CoA hydratase-related protein [Mycobacteriales bacterium]|jgi:enoyl-CoA hydratase|nr:enoyl-CoA hydratase-related protein [Mycobacteriales bacterium]